VNEYANECENVSASIDVAAEMRNVFSIEGAYDCGSAYDGRMSRRVQCKCLGKEYKMRV
jgi:hypothetical protein